jgi:ubiquinol-cytochrome c reductase cytochrome c1 subunit
MKKILFLALMLPFAAYAAGGQVRLDKAPIDTGDAVSIQRGARVFVNYCLNCHSAQYMRYNGLMALGLTEQQIRDNLLLGAGKVGDTMTVAMRPSDAKEWFGVVPPDLSVVARSRGADWLYTYLRSYYRDGQTATGWNNLVFPNVGMPHVLWELQGQQALRVTEESGPHGKHSVTALVVDQPGTLSRNDYNRLVADLVNYLVFMGEPGRASRIRMGYIALIAVGVLFVLFYLLKREYWKDIH